MNPIYRHSFADVFFKTGIINTNTGALITSGDAVQNRYYSTYVSVSNVYPRVLLINAGVDRGAFYDSDKKFISSFIGVTTGSVDIPNNAYYLRFVVYKTSYNAGTVFARLGTATAQNLIYGRKANPIYKDDLAKEYELETNQRFYRAKLSGKISFIRDDYDFINTRPFDYEFLYGIDKSNDGGKTWVPYFSGKFMKTDCTFVDYDKKVTVQPDTIDDYNEVLAGLEKEYNLITLAPEIVRLNYDKRPLIQVYTPGESVVSNFSSGAYWEQDSEVITDKEELQNKYHFALAALLKEIVVTPHQGSPAAVATTYKGMINISSDGKTFEGRLNPVDPVNYYMYVKQVYQGLGDYSAVTFEIRRASTDEVYFRYFNTTGGKDFDNATFIMDARGDVAKGEMQADMTTYNMFVRYMLDVEKIGDDNTYPIPSEDIVENNSNYKYVIGLVFPDMFYMSSNYSDTPTEWGLAPNGKYYLPVRDSILNYRFYPVARSTWAYTSIWFKFSIFDTIYDQRGRKQYTLRDAYPLSSCIQVLLNEFAPGITHEATSEYSQFLYGSTNPITNAANRTLLISQKTNVIRGDYDQPAQKAPITLQQITNMLRDVFKCYWYIEDGKFKIEHILYFRNGGSYSYVPSIGADLTQLETTRLNKKWAFNTSEWTFDKVDMAERYQFEWMDDVTEFFEGYPIQVLSKYVSQGKIEDISISNFNPDIDYMLMNPNEISTDGFALFLADGSGNQYTLPYYEYRDEYVDSYKLQNGFCALVYTIPTFWVYDLPARRVNINKKNTTARGIERGKKQQVSYPSLEDPNPMKLIKTYIGNGQVDKISVNLQSRMNKITLKYDTE